MIDNSNIVDKIRVKKNLATENDVAELFGLSPKNFSNRKKRGTLLHLFVEWAINENVDLNWLLKGNLQGRSPPETEARPPPARGSPVQYEPVQRSYDDTKLPDTWGGQSGSVSGGEQCDDFAKIITVFEQWIKETGIEIPPAHKARLFSMLYQK